MSVPFQIRPATEADVPAITAIYNEAIRTTTATFDLEEQTLESRLAWFHGHGTDFPVFVAEKDHRVAGYVSLSHWADKEAYDISAEISLYIESSSRGQGIGKALAMRVMESAKTTRLCTVVSRITGGNEASLRIHEQVGFTVIGTMHRCGRKFGQILDVVFLEKVLR